MINSRHAFGAALAALLVSSLAITGCEKTAGSGEPAVTAAAGDDGGAGSTVPGLPFLAKPVFSPDLVNMVGGGDLFAVAEGKLAQSQSSAPDVKSFAASSIDAHTKSSAAIGSVIERSGQTISMPDSMPADFQAKVTALQKLSGGAFDKTYLADQIAVQQGEVTALRFFAQHGDSAPFKTYAVNAAAAVEKNLATAQALHSSLK